MKEITQEYVKELFDYKDGILYNKTYRSSNAKIGDKAGYLQKDGYSQINVNNKQYKTHRIIYLYHYGFIPKMIDHIDRDPTNNKIENLRETTYQQNNWNAKPNKNTSSKYKGVDWHKSAQKWQVRIQINEKRINLGLFKNESDAAIAYNTKAIELFGEFAYLNEVE